MGYDSLNGSREKVGNIKELLKEIADNVDLLEQDLEGRATEMETTNAKTTETTEA